MFKILTTNTNFLSSVFDSHKDLNILTKKFLKRLNGCLHQCFKKIKISGNGNKEIDELFDRRKELKTKVDDKSREELENIEKELANKCANNNYIKIKNEIAGIKCEEGGIHSGKLWKLRKKLFPRSRDPPTAMLDGTGNLVTSQEKIEAIALETYQKRLENRDIIENLSDIKTEKEDLCARRLEVAALNKTPEWSIEDLQKVLKYLKLNKSRDPFGYANEIFRPEVAGDDLQLAILKLMNKIKYDQTYPKALEYCNISSIWKLKGQRNDWDNYRGIFRVTIFRTILDRLIYNDEYEKIDSNLTDSNVGAQKGRNIRDNIFVMNAIMNSVVRGNEEPIDIQVFDVEKCFDALWLQECINDIYEAGLDNDKLPLLFLENQNAQVGVKTSLGVSKRVEIKNIVMQGSVWGGLMCTTTMDQLAQMVYLKEDLLYKYKGLVSVPPVCMVDDLMSIQKCSDAVKINAAINAFIELKKLTLSKLKCSRVHIGKQKSDCPVLHVHKTEMKSSKKEKYLGDYIEQSGNMKATLDDRVSKGHGIIAEIKAILNEIPLGRYKLEIGLKLRQAMLINGMLYNSEAWHSITNQDIKVLERIDETLLRFLLSSHSKTPLEFLYLESGAIPIRYITSSRRLNFLQTILKREDDELTKRVLKAQIENPTEGDFIDLVRNDCEELEIPYDLNIIESTGVNSFKNIVKVKVREAAIKYLRSLQARHSKVKSIEYTKLFNKSFVLKL